MRFTRSNRRVLANISSTASLLIDALALFAGIHPKPIGNPHRSLAKRFPFAIHYDLNDEVATVVAVLDCRQNPASITERLQRS